MQNSQLNDSFLLHRPLNRVNGQRKGNEDNLKANCLKKIFKASRKSKVQIMVDVLSSFIPTFIGMDTTDMKDRVWIMEHTENKGEWVDRLGIDWTVEAAGSGNYNQIHRWMLAENVRKSTKDIPDQAKRVLATACVKIYGEDLQVTSLLGPP